jgi:plastocyanin
MVARIRRAILALGTLVAVALLAAACGGGGGGSSTSEQEGGTTTIAGKPAAEHGTKDVSGESEIDLEADDFYFEPTILEGSPGEKLKIEVENEGSATHTFTIDSQNVDVTVQPDGKREVDVTFPQSGTLRFYCRFHASQGMAGALRVKGS